MDPLICWPDRPTSLIDQKEHAGARNKGHRSNLERYFRSFGTFVKSNLLRSLNQHLYRQVEQDDSCSIWIDKLNMTTSHPIRLSISLRLTTTPHSLCSLLRTVSQDTPIIYPRLITLLTTIFRLGSLFPIGCNSALFSDNTEQGGLMISVQLRPFTFPLTSSQFTDFFR